MKGLIGKKVGMTQVYDDKGHRVAVTVLEAGPCVVVQRKTDSTDGYNSVQLGFADKRESRMTKPLIGHFGKAGVSPKSFIREFDVDDKDADLKVGDSVTASAVFEGVTHVDVSGTTKGRGFQGPVKRFNAAGGRMTHGGHSKRRIGSIGQCSYPARVVKGQKMPGHMGNVIRTVQNLRLVSVRDDENLLLVQGAVPGAVGSMVIIKRALKVH